MEDVGKFLIILGGILIGIYIGNLFASATLDKIEEDYRKELVKEAKMRDIYSNSSVKELLKEEE